jgi:hypothetical protein
VYGRFIADFDEALAFGYQMEDHDSLGTGLE